MYVISSIELKFHGANPLTEHLTILVNCISCLLSPHSCVAIIHHSMSSVIVLTCPKYEKIELEKEQRLRRSKFQIPDSSLSPTLLSGSLYLWDDALASHINHHEPHPFSLSHTHTMDATILIWGSCWL